MLTRRSLLQSALATLGTALTFGLGLGGKRVSAKATTSGTKAKPVELKAVPLPDCWGKVTKNCGGGWYEFRKVEPIAGGRWTPDDEDGLDLVWAAWEINGTETLPVGEIVRLTNHPNVGWLFRATNCGYAVYS